MLQNASRKPTIFEIFTLHDFATFREKINTEEENATNEEKFKGPEIFKKLKIKAEEK